MSRHWSLKTAARDAKRHSSSLLLIFCTMVIGVAGIVSLHGFRDALLREIAHQSKALFGADLAVKYRGVFAEEHQTFLERIPGTRTREQKFTSMLYMPAVENSRFVVVSAVGSGFPLYGALQTEPRQAAENLFGTRGILIDATLATQFDLKVDDRVRLGEAEFSVLGIVHSIPGDLDIQGMVAPRVFISLDKLSETNLIRLGSRVRSYEYYRFEGPLDVAALVDRLEPEAAKNYLRIDTSEERQERLQEVVRSVTRYSQLVALAAVLLGALGAASLAHVYIQKRRRDIGVLRCLGVSQRQLNTLFLTQIGAAGFAGVLLGCLAGLFMQRLLPIVFEGFLPLPVQGGVSYSGPLLGAAIGLLALLAFAIVPVLQVGRVSPMSTIRLDETALRYSRRDKTMLALSAITGIFLCALVILADPLAAVLYTFGLVFLTALLFLLAELAIKFVARFRNARGPFSLRQGIANISRPQNQTRVLLVVLGLGAFLVFFISLVRELTLQKIAVLDTAQEPNILAFDVQLDQRDTVLALMQEQGLQVFDAAALVSMRLTRVKGTSVNALLADKDSEIPKWTLSRTYRSTYRAGLESSEELLRGEIVDTVPEGLTDIPVTLEERIMEELQLELGDSLEFDVEGVPLTVRAVGVRKVDWQQVKPNFFVVFPNGVLEEAPQTFVITARAQNVEQAAAFQRSLAGIAPNVSVIDIHLIQQSLDAILSRLSFASQALGLLCVLVACVMLVATILSTRAQRLREYQILKFHGASERTVIAVGCVEYALISFVAVVFAGLAAYLAATALSFRLYDQGFLILDTRSLYLAAFVFFGGVAISMLASAGMYRRPAVELLRSGS